MATENFSIKAWYATFPFGWQYYFNTEEKRSEFIKEKEKERNMYVVEKGQTTLLIEEGTIWEQEQSGEKSIIDNLPIEFLDRLGLELKIAKKK